MFPRHNKTVVSLIALVGLLLSGVGAASVPVEIINGSLTLRSFSIAGRKP
jgi:hypothetical protein